jgi:ornithine cyclodeaminase
MRILGLEEIKSYINLPKIIAMQEEGFKAYSAGQVNVPPVGYLKQQTPPGAYHIKYGMITKDDVWVIKIVGGPSGVPSHGMMIVLSTATGKPEFLLQDNSYLTQLRTAIAGRIAAKYLAPRNISSIGVLGTGLQARMQVEILQEETACRQVYVWGRTPSKAIAYKQDMEEKGFTVHVAGTPHEVAQNCNLIITATSSREHLLQASDVLPGTHITAMGADAPGKTELDPFIIAKADVVAVDSKSQCIDHGEICSAYQKRMITDHRLIELGGVIANPNLGRTNENQITVADLTGVAVQDIQIAKAIVSNLQQ